MAKTQTNVVRRKRKRRGDKVATTRNWTIYRLKGHRQLLNWLSQNATDNEVQETAEIGLSVLEDLIQLIKQEN